MIETKGWLELSRQGGSVEEYETEPTITELDADWQKVPPPIRAAYEHVEALWDNKGADGTLRGNVPYWHGWAVREAFLAGVDWAVKNRIGPPPEEE